MGDGGLGDGVNVDGGCVVCGVAAGDGFGPQPARTATTKGARGARCLAMFVRGIVRASLNTKQFPVDLRFHGRLRASRSRSALWVSPGSAPGSSTARPALGTYLRPVSPQLAGSAEGPRSRAEEAPSSC